jgi:hypothetical protein
MRTNIIYIIFVLYTIYTNYSLTKALPPSQGGKIFQDVTGLRFGNLIKGCH